MMPITTSTVTRAPMALARALSMVFYVLYCGPTGA